MKAIITKYLPPTNTRGARIKAYAADVKPLVISYPDTLDSDAAHRLVATLLCEQQEWNNVKLHQGGHPDGKQEVFVVEGEQSQKDAQPPCGPKGFVYFGPGPMKNPSGLDSPDLACWNRSQRCWEYGMYGNASSVTYYVRSGSELAKLNGLS